MHNKNLQCWVRFPGRKNFFGFFCEILNNKQLGVRICARLLVIGSPPITWDLIHTGELWVYIGTTLPKPSGNTGVMVKHKFI